MIESVCKNCGNKKSFTEDKIGRKYKCPECSETVTIESIGGNINIEAQESINVTDSYEKSIDEAEKRKSDQEAVKEKWGMGCGAIFFLLGALSTFKECLNGVGNAKEVFWFSTVIFILIVVSYFFGKNKNKK